MTKEISTREWEALSAYIDGQLSSKEQARLEIRLQSNPDLRTAMEELRQTRAVLRSQPKLRAPRNFTLTPEMAGIRRERRPAPRGYPFLRLASALATLMLVLVLVGDFVIGPDRAGVLLQSASAPQATQVAMGPAEESQAAQPLLQAVPAPEQETPGMGGGGPAPTAPALAGAESLAQSPTTGAGIASAATPTPEGTPPYPRAAAPLEGTPQPPMAAKVAPETEAPAESATGPSAYDEGELPAQSQYPSIESAPLSAFRQTAPGGLLVWRLVEAFLALVAVGSGLAALYLRRIGNR